MDSENPELEDEFPDPLIGTMVGRFRIERKIGQGGMGAVYALLQPAIHKRMALKLLHEHYVARKDIVQRFFGEARAVNLIGHPNIVDISDFSHLPDGRPFIIMEFLEGQSLEEYLDERGALSAAETVALLKQICSALGAAHTKGIYHRDIKPENFFITKNHDGSNFLKVLDFGIAKLKDGQSDSDQDHVTHTATGIVLGTPTYMSPEQAEGNTQGADQRTDIYSLGVVMYQMLTGVPPFVGQSFAELIIKHVQKPPPSIRTTRSDLPPAWDRILSKALAKKPEDRYQSMDALYADAQATLSIPPAKPEQYTPKSGPWLQHKVLWLAVPLLLFAAALGLLWTLEESPAKASGPTLTKPQSAGAVVARKVQVDAGQALKAERLGLNVDDTGAEVGRTTAPTISSPDASTPEPETSNHKRPTLKKNRGRGTLKVTAYPWAKIYVNGKLVGPSPIEVTLATGKHKVRFVNTSNNESVRKRVTIKKDKQVKIHHRW